jgi:ElaB/YqjD/DUF883 family membrane-anchored ribosome-binding protein
MDDEDVIRDQMAETRTALTEKLEALEAKVADTVDSATTTVAQTVEAVKETVTTAKDTVQGTIGAVKEKVEESVEAVKDAFDIKAHVQQHPWVSFGASVAAGYLLERYVDSLFPRRSPASRPSPAMGMLSDGQTQPTEQQPERAHKKGPGWLRAMLPGLEKLQGLAVEALVSSVRDMVVQAAPPAFKDRLADAFNSIASAMQPHPHE